MSYVYIDSEPGLFTVGFYDPKGKWHPDSDSNSREEAAARVRFLNGGNTEWLCGCGHANGSILPYCAGCGRKPNGEHP